MLEALFFSNLATIVSGLALSISKTRLHIFISISGALILVQSALIGLRDPSMMTDTREYASLFLGNSGFEEKIEPAFMALVFLIRKLTSQVDVFLIVISALLNIIYFSFLYILLNRYSLLAFGLFGSTFSYWIVHVQTLRSGLACVLLLLGIALFLTRNYWRSAFLIFASIATHFSMAVVSAGVLMGYVASDIKFKKVILAFMFIISIFLIYDRAIPSLPFFAPWKQRLDAYSYYAENNFVNSSFGYQYVFLIIILLSFSLFWKKQHNTMRTLFFIYVAVAALSFAFWSNILYRDRVFILAQLIEPLLLTSLSYSVFGKLAGSLLVFCSGVIMSVLVIFYWGPRTVLLF